jgi:hypothetical protein
MENPAIGVNIILSLGGLVLLHLELRDNVHVAIGSSTIAPALATDLQFR